MVRKKSLQRSQLLMKWANAIHRCAQRIPRAQQPVAAGKLWDQWIANRPAIQDPHRAQADCSRGCGTGQCPGLLLISGTEPGKLYC